MTRPTHPAAQPAQPRNNALAQIHIAKAQLGLDDDTYRAMLWAQARVKSAAELDYAGREHVLAHLRASGFKAGTNPNPNRTPGAHPGKPHKPALHKADQVRKVEALIADAGRPWAYAHGMCVRMFKVDRVEFCNGEQLGKLIAALTYDAQRRAKRLAQEIVPALRGQA